MMSKAISICLISSMFIFGTYGYDGETTPAVTLAGGIIKAKSIINNNKYKRKDCPVCKGKGWYVSGDDITKVPCGYCEPDTTQILSGTHNGVIKSGTIQCGPDGCRVISK